MPDAPRSTAARDLIGDFDVSFAEITDDVLYTDVWNRPDLSPRDRSLITVSSLITNGSTQQLRGHLRRARANGVTEPELKAAIVHLAFYAGWPRAMSAVSIAREVFAE